MARQVREAFRILSAFLIHWLAHPSIMDFSRSHIAFRLLIRRVLLGKNRRQLLPKNICPTLTVSTLALHQYGAAAALCKARLHSLQCPVLRAPCWRGCLLGQQYSLATPSTS